MNTLLAILTLVAILLLIALLATDLMTRLKRARLAKIPALVSAPKSKAFAYNEKPNKAWAVMMGRKSDGDEAIILIRIYSTEDEKLNKAMADELVELLNEQL